MKEPSMKEATKQTNELQPQCFPHHRKAQQQPREHHDRAGDVALGILPFPDGSIRGDADNARKLGLREAERLAGGLEIGRGHSALNQAHGALAHRRTDRVAGREARRQLAEGVQIGAQRFLGRSFWQAATDKRLRCKLGVARLEFLEFGIEAVVHFEGDFGHRRLRFWRPPLALRQNEYRPIGPVLSTPNAGRSENNHSLGRGACAAPQAESDPRPKGTNESSRN